MNWEELKKLLPKIQRNVLLRHYTTFKIGGPAKYFFVAKTKKDLIKAVKVAKKINLPFFILGGGSNLLVSDEGFDGLIIKIKNQNLKIKNANQKSKIIEAEAGVSLSQLVSVSLKNSLTGLEWAVGIPGTVGGAIWGNAGAFGKSMKDIIKSVKVLEVKNKKSKIKNLTNRDCRFGYRDSIFKKNPNLIILSTEIKLEKGNKKEIKEKMKENLTYRKQTQPLSFPSAGSIFKNPKDYFAAKLIEKTGLKGKKIGNAQISKKHANFIVNLKRAKAIDVIQLINLVKKEVKKKCGIDLKEEIQYLGF